MERRETNLIKHTDYIYEYQDAIDLETVDYIRTVLNEKLSGINQSDIEENDIRKNKGYKIYLHRDKGNDFDQVSNILEKMMMNWISRYYRDCTLMREYYKPLGKIATSPVYRFYNETDYYNWHCDTTERFSFLASFILYLNDDFSGGDTLFMNDKLRVSPKVGSILMFPCGPYFIHKSSPIKEGSKHIVWNCYLDIPQVFVDAM